MVTPVYQIFAGNVAPGKSGSGPFIQVHQVIPPVEIKGPVRITGSTVIFRDTEMVARPVGIFQEAFPECTGMHNHPGRNRLILLQYNFLLGRIIMMMTTGEEDTQHTEP
jgi:hypothetical protein